MELLIWNMLAGLLRPPEPYEWAPFGQGLQDRGYKGWTLGQHKTHPIFPVERYWDADYIIDYVSAQHPTEGPLWFYRALRYVNRKVAV